MTKSLVHLALPKGRMEQGVLALLADAGIRVTFGRRGYRPSLSLAGFETKILKPQNIVEMLHLGSRDIGFAGADWVAELSAELVELLDTGLDPVAVVAAAAPEFAAGGLERAPFVVASEYQRLTLAWLERRGLARPSCIPMVRPRCSRPRTPTASSTTWRPARRSRPMA